MRKRCGRPALAPAPPQPDASRSAAPLRSAGLLPLQRELCFQQARCAGRRVLFSKQRCLPRAVSAPRANHAARSSCARAVSGTTMTGQRRSARASRAASWCLHCARDKSWGLQPCKAAWWPLHSAGDAARWRVMPAVQSRPGTAEVRRQQRFCARTRTCSAPPWPTTSKKKAWQVQ